MFKGIDFYSDTVTRPTPGMRQAMANAEVGDEQKGEDPTTRKLEEKLAGLLGKTSALFFPCATMANEVAILLHCQRGDELIAAEGCHLFVAEAGGPAAHAGAMCKPVQTVTGIFDGQAIRKNFTYAEGSHYPVSRMVSVENTANMSGGIAWPLATLDDVLDTAKELRLKTHMDGARLFNAVVKTGVPVNRITSRFDTITVCLSKGLGCPTGAILGFDQEKWPQVRRLKQLMGGAMRQSGILAAAGLYALENHIARLQEDHDNAKRLAEHLSRLPSVQVENLEPSTNMVFFRWESSRGDVNAFLRATEERGVRFSGAGGNRVRAVVHLDTKREDIDRAFQILKEIDN